MADSSTFDKIRIGIASPEDIKSWSSGEVKKPETINYRTFKPERDGLFCERIFGPVKDWECHCGRYKKVKFKGVVCDRCGVEVTRSKVRRERMGHVTLAAPVSHIWYLKGVPSPMGLLLDMSPRPLERVLYYASYIVTAVDRQRINDHLEQIRTAVAAECENASRERDESIADARAEYAKTEAENPEWDDRKRKDHDKKLNERIKQLEHDAAELVEEMHNTLTLLESIRKLELITEDQYRALSRLLDVVSERLELDLEDVFRAGMGGAAVKELLAEIDLEKLRRELDKEIHQTTGPKRARSIKRLEIADAFRNSKSRPEWMILDIVPIISPELRPMVQLDGGRFATSDLNDLYRRIINRNNRLKKITEIRAPESIINHEKRLLQEAVDALIDNGRRSRPVVGSNNRPLKSLSDMLKGKEGRFRKNLLGKRVDYSGRSVIVVGPAMKLHQCGLPKEMALELFKPFVMKTLVEKKYTSNIKTAKRMIDRMKPEVWDALEEVISEHPVMLNRAPTLHRLGIQAFEPILVDGKAIQLHPLVCHAFNADFDGDQMAVHVPLSASAQSEARCLMLSTHNLFSPADGRPVVAPIQDIVLGSFYLTMKNEAWPEERKPRVFASEEDALMAYRDGQVDVHEPIEVRLQVGGECFDDAQHAAFEDAQHAACPERSRMVMTVGRLIFNNILPMNMRYIDSAIDKKTMARIVSECYEKNGHERTVKLLDDIKELGFRYATFSGITISMTDMDIPSKRDEIVERTQDEVQKKNRAYARGLITQAERKEQVLQLWTRAAEEVADAIVESVDQFNPISIITTSGARGSKRQITQLAGMRGLMSDPFGNLIEDLPIKSNFHEGLSILEYFISTHGARKGLADTALRTADAGYLTRRLVDVAQDVIVRGVDCGTVNGIYVSQITDGGDVVEPLSDRLKGRTALEDVFLPGESEPIVAAGELISDSVAKQIDKAGLTKVGIRSALMCELRQGICSKCYGLDLSYRKPVEVGTAVGIIAAQSIGEPGTQLTMRTFHTGGVAGQYLTGVAEVKKKKQESLRDLHQDIRKGFVSIEDGGEVPERERSKQVQAVLKVLEDQVRGLLRVVELFEARKPKGQAIITEDAGKVVDIEMRGLKRVVIHSTKLIEEATSLSGEVAAEPVVHPETGETMVEAGADLNEKLLRKIKDAGVETVSVKRSFLVPHRGNLEVELNEEIAAGSRLTEGPLDPHKVLELHGVRGIMEYLVQEIQNVYKSQGVDINDKHVEVIVRQMLRKRRVVEKGDTRFLPGQITDKFDFNDENERVRNAGGTEATADWVLLGITEASLATDSFLSAASFQKTTRVLTEAAVKGKSDNLVGLKENVIIGRLIPAGTGLPRYRGCDVMDEQGEKISLARQLLDTRSEREDEDLLPEDLEEVLDNLAGDHLDDMDEDLDLLDESDEDEDEDIPLPDEDMEDKLDDDDDLPDFPGIVEDDEPMDEDSDTAI